MTRLMEDCYGLMELKVTWTDLNWVFLFVFCCCCFVFCFLLLLFVVVVVLLLLFFFLGGGGGGRRRVKLFHCIVRTGVYDILCV